MMAAIVSLLQQRKANASQEWLENLPRMAKRLEECLYRSAKSFDEYTDANTLKHRLKQLAAQIEMKTEKSQLQQALMQQQRALHEARMELMQQRRAQHEILRLQEQHRARMQGLRAQRANHGFRLVLRLLGIHEAVMVGL